MYRIIDERGAGKTSRLMLIAKEENAIFVCKNPNIMREKSYKYGITGIDFISYDEFLLYDFSNNRKVVIDDLEEFIKDTKRSCDLIGYTLSRN